MRNILKKDVSFFSDENRESWDGTSLGEYGAVMSQYGWQWESRFADGGGDCNFFTAIKWNPDGAFALGGNIQNSAGAVGLFQVHWQIWACQYSGIGHSVFQNPDGHRVLFAAQETFSAVNWINAPSELRVLISLMVNPFTDLVKRNFLS